MFSMGAPDKETDAYPTERPSHTVRISKAFHLGVYEVTQGQYQTVTGGNPSRFCSTGGGKELVTGISTDRLPVECVSWLDAVGFCNTLSTREGLEPFYRIAGETVTIPSWDGKGFRLPNEAEWEYACRAGTQTKWSYGDEYSPPIWHDYSWQADNSGRELWDAEEYFHHSAKGDWTNYFKELARRGCRTHPVGEKRPNAFGLYDMHGNVAEWCWDWFGRDAYQRGYQENPTGPVSGASRVFRGGKWSGSPWDDRSTFRSAFELPPTAPHRDIGFRLARTAE